VGGLRPDFLVTMLWSALEKLVQYQC